MSWIQSVTEAISSLFCRSSEAQVLRIKLKYAKKSDKEFWDNRFKSIFANASVEELQLMQKLVYSNNAPQKVKFEISLDEEVMIDGVKEKLYQIIKKKESDDCWERQRQNNIIVRITVPVYKQFCKEFNKYGRQRIPNQSSKGG